MIPGLLVSLTVHGTFSLGAVRWARCCDVTVVYPWNAEAWCVFGAPRSLSLVGSWRLY